MVWQYVTLLFCACILYYNGYDCKSECKTAYGAITKKMINENSSAEVIQKLQERGDKYCYVYCEAPKETRLKCHDQCQGNPEFHQCFIHCASNQARMESEEIESPESESQVEVDLNVYCYEVYITVKETFSWGSFEYTTPTIQCEIV